MANIKAKSINNIFQIKIFFKSFIKFTSLDNKDQKNTEKVQRNGIIFR